MKTLELSASEMERCIARYSKLEPQKKSYADRGIPVEAFEMLAAKTIYLLMAPRGEKGFTANPLIDGAPGLTVNIVECPPGNGPMLHAHRDTRESFMCLTGRWEVRWGDEGEHSTILDRFDLIAVPPGVGRAFTNVSEETALLLVLIQGEEAQNDVFYAPAVGEELARRFGPSVKPAFEKIGIRFTMGVDD